MISRKMLVLAVLILEAFVQADEHDHTVGKDDGCAVCTCV